MAPLLNIPAPSKLAVGVRLAARVLSRDGWRCVYCGRTRAPLEIDHVTPCAHFPAAAPRDVVNDAKNLVTACVGCNGAKGPQNLDGFVAMLRGRGVAAKDIDAMLGRVRESVRRRLPRGARL